jgi:hypothetical protein
MYMGTLCPYGPCLLFVSLIFLSCLLTNIRVVSYPGVEVEMIPTPSKDDEDDEAFLRSLPEEDRRQLTSAAWHGGFRWFRSPNVIPLERYRNSKRKDQTR